MHKRKNQKGFVKLSRNILEWGWYSDPTTRGVFMHLIIKANHAPHAFMGVIIGRGQIVTGYKSLAVELGFSTQNVRTAFKNLKSTGEITVKVTSKFSIVTLCNYELYNPSKEKANKQSNSLANKHLTSIQQASNTKQEEEEEIEEEEYRKKPKNKKSTMVPPTLQEVSSYIQEKRYNVNARDFFDKYENENPPWSNNKGKPMTSWKSTLVTWNCNAQKNNQTRNRDSDGYTH